jgi:hypothetical protein
MARPETTLPLETLQSPSSAEINDAIAHTVLIEERSGMTADQVLAAISANTSVSGDQVVVLDFPLCSTVDTENELLAQKELIGYVARNGIKQIDHHASDPRFYRFISTTPLVEQYLKAGGVFSESTVLVLNHTDTDSILSVMIATGIIKMYQQDLIAQAVEAAIAADHTGAANQLADTLNGLEKYRDVTLSVKAALAILYHQAENPIAIAGRRDREQQRALALEAVRLGEFTQVEPRQSGVYVHVSASNEPLRTELLVDALPAASLIITAALSTFPTASGHRPSYVYKLRAGRNWPKGRSITELDLELFGGRWNAGGTLRSKRGLNTPPLLYAGIAADMLFEVMQMGTNQRYMR